MDGETARPREKKHQHGKESDSLKSIPGAGVTFFGKKS
jgi:hypothetical protein